MGYAIRVADLGGDKEAILSLWNDNLQLISEQRFRWIFEMNPVKPVQCWIAAVDGKGEPAGTVSLFPREVYIDGKSVKSGIPGYFAVNKQHRVLGPAVLLQRAVVNACSADGFEFIYACPNKAAEAAFSRTGYRDLGAIGVYSNPLRSAYVLRRHMPASLANLLGPVVDFSLRAFSLTIFRRKGGNLRLLEVERFDDRIDQLWNNAAHSFRVAGFRSGEYLNWRYKDCPQRVFRSFIVCNEKDEVVAYFATYRDGKIEKIADFFALNSELLETSLYIFAQHLRRTGVESVTASFFGSREIAAAIKNCGFFLRASDEKLFVYGGELLNQVLNPQDWYLTEGETHY